MRLPSSQRAIVDIRKLRDYCLDPRSPKGRDKAKVFAAALGLTRPDADLLRQALLRPAAEQDCVAGEADEYGRRYTVDFVMETSAGRHRIRNGWIVRSGEAFPRLTTCYVMRAKRSER
jgi:hypothetical protein